ncbi:uncharacterized protein PG998_008042 [Apiospora kogelbergensis]|uniref:uncharacterized protein n=1 Tax=Apiospora kogelbergensis TaxID=1337665 RepID=UPI00312FE1C2
MRAGNVSASQPVASASFMPRFTSSQRRRGVVADSSDEEVAIEGAVLYGDSSDDEDELPSLDQILPPRSSQSVSTRLNRTVLSDDDDEEEDDVPVPSSSLRRRAPVINLDSDEDDELVVLSPAKRRKIGHSSQPRRPNTDDSSSDNQPIKSPTKSARKLVTRKGHRSDKQKKMELLRRRRAGEKIEQLTSSESEDGGEKRGLYDTDSDEGMQALKEFEDDDDEVDVEAVPPPSKKSAKKSKPPKKASKQSSDEEKDSDLDDFIESDEDGPLGAPDVSIPLEFTAQATLPLKDQFPFVVDWLVHNRINPRFDRKDPVYANAWRKLDDEVRGLASSKFTSSVWKAEFYRALRGRPKIDTYEMDAGDTGKYEICEACGRSGHPATWRIEFQGTPYRKDTLDEIESDSDSESDKDDDEIDDHASIDSQGNSLPPTNKQWVVGSTCCSNAETAHSLLHWKYALKEWVEDQLEKEGWMKADKLKEREKLKPKKRNKLANRIVGGWDASGVVKALYGDFKKNLEDARNKTTTGRGRWR